MNDAENKTTSRKELGTYFQNVCSEPDEEGLKAREEESREKLFRNQLGIVCSYQKHVADTDLSRSQHLLPARGVGPARWVSTTHSGAGTPGVDLARWTEMRRASESTRELKGKETCAFDGNTFYFDLQASLQIFSAERSLFRCGKWEKKVDSGPLTHEVVPIKANEGVANGKPEKLRLINVTAQVYRYFMVIRTSFILMAA